LEGEKQAGLVLEHQARAECILAHEYRMLQIGQIAVLRKRSCIPAAETQPAGIDLPVAECRVSFFYFRIMTMNDSLQLRFGPLCSRVA
jgi:hypothetical protein